MIVSYIDEVWPLRHLLAVATVLVLAIFWILRKRSFRDLVAVLLAAMVLITLMGTFFWLFNPGKADWKRLVMYDLFGWIAALLVWIFNKLFRTEATFDVEDKHTKPISSDDPTTR